MCRSLPWYTLFCTSLYHLLRNSGFCVPYCVTKRSNVYCMYALESNVYSSTVGCISFWRCKYNKHTKRHFSSPIPTVSTGSAPTPSRHWSHPAFKCGQTQSSTAHQSVLCTSWQLGLQAWGNAWRTWDSVLLIGFCWPPALFMASKAKLALNLVSASVLSRFLFLTHRVRVKLINITD